MLKKIFSMGYRVLTKLPSGVIARLYNIFFRFIPFWILKRIPSSYAGYLQQYRPVRGDVVVDAGAYSGNFCILASRLVGAQGRVIALEPDAAIREKLAERMRKMRLKNVDIYPFGLWNCREKLQFTAGSEGSGTLLPENNEEATVSVDCIDLDALVEEASLKRLDFIKMDIEGAELEALEGASDALSVLKPHFAVATYHVRDGETTASRIEAALRNFGYTVSSGYDPHPTTYGIPPR